MDVQQKLDEIAAAVQSAKSMPMSASCVINRSELLERLEQVRSALPGSLAQAQEVLGDREQVVAQAQEEARRIVEAAHSERGSLVGNTEVAQQARNEATRILAEARREAAEVKAEADDYVDSKLANFEVVLGKTIGSVDRGREKLLGPDRGDQAELLANAEAYVEAQFGAIEAVLRKTLEAVGRGRQKLTGYRPIDELAEHVAAQDAGAADGGARPADAYQQQDHEQGIYDYLGMARAEQPAGAGYPEADPYAALQPTASTGGYGQQQDGYAQEGYAQGGGYGQQESYQGQDVYPGQDAYAGQAGYGGQGAAGGYAQEPPYGGQPALPAVPTQPPSYDYRPAGTLDEASLFDTSMIDAEQLRRYQQGQH
ncbi:cell division initiation protein [Streptomyces hainanensis]|uniref:Cell division initiation protein n=1 Tax=Streptomyces hainanensis TaxID=402648 RepID=A0A4R4TNM1_9ACTN|nr:cell division initiation protein [Streptomyces hainanensis]TDC79778.1 cell division initiation protein [Streptomyces hainanensis]